MMNGAKGGKLPPKIAIVRAFLNSTGSLDMNPFLCHVNEAVLDKTFADFAEGIESGIMKLSELTGARMPDLQDRKTPEYLASGYIAESKATQKPVDCILYDAFNRSSAPSYFALRELEAQEKEGAAYSQARVEAAMDGMVALYMLAKAVPLVHEQLSRKADPVPAVA